MANDEQEPAFARGFPGFLERIAYRLGLACGWVERRWCALRGIDTAPAKERRKEKIRQLEAELEQLEREIERDDK